MDLGERSKGEDGGRGGEGRGGQGREMKWQWGCNICEKNSKSNKDMGQRHWKLK